MRKDREKFRIRAKEPNKEICGCEVKRNERKNTEKETMTR